MQHAIAPKGTEAKGWHASRCVALLACLLLGACSAEEAPAERTDQPRRLAAAEAPTVLAGIERLDEFATVRRALAATGRAALLSGNAPVTLLAPRDTAFVQLDPARREALLAPANRAALTTAIDGLIVPRALRADELRQMISDGGGSAVLQTRAGTVTVSSAGDMLILTTPSGVRATMGSAEIATGNGMIYVLDRWPAAAP